MARTRGAKDKSRRKQPAAKIRTPVRPSGPSHGSELAAGTPPGLADRPAVPPGEFEAAIAAELGNTETIACPGPAPSGVTAQPAPAQFDPGALTLDGLASAWQCAFYALGTALAWLRITPDPEPVYAVGRRRGKELAKPSYVIYEHYTRQYLQLNPENTVHVAAGATGLNAIGILPDLIDAVIGARRKAAAKAAQGQPTPVPGST